MAANTTGHKQTDHLRIIGLAETAAEFAREILAPGGAYLAKVFQGGTEGHAARRPEARLRQPCATSSRMRAGPIRASSTSGDGLSRPDRRRRRIAGRLSRTDPGHGSVTIMHCVQRSMQTHAELCISDDFRLKNLCDA